MNPVLALKLTVNENVLKALSGKDGNVAYFRNTPLFCTLRTILLCRCRHHMWYAYWNKGNLKREDCKTTKSLKGKYDSDKELSVTVTKKNYNNLPRGLAE